MIFLFVGALIFAACSKKDDYKLMTIVGFTQELYGIDLNQETELTVLSTGPLTGEVPFTLSDNLKEGVDFEFLGDKSFVFDNAMEAHVKIRFLKNIPENTLLEVRLSPVSFATLALAKTTVGIDATEAILYTFSAPLYYMTESADISLVLNKITGTFSAETAQTFEAEVDLEKSTAVEGKHFSFPNGKKIVVPVGKSSGTLKLKLLKEEKGKDKIVLKLKVPSANFKPGNFDEAAVTVYVTSFESLTGSWKYVDFTTYDYLDMNTSWLGDVPTDMPIKNSDRDILTFDNDMLSVSMTGDIRKYFRDTKLVKKGEIVEVLMEESGYPKVNVMLVEGLANVSFSAAKINERKAEIGFRLRIIDGKEYLDVTVRDFEPVDFLQNTYDMAKDWGDYPIMQFYPLRFRFERVE